MKNISTKIKNIGFDNWFQEKIGPQGSGAFEIARVVAVHKDSYTISNGEVELLAELVGKIVYGAASSLDYPTVGDWVLASFLDENTFSIIHEILPRKSILKRKTPGKKIDFQLIATNVDVAFILQSLDENFNLRRLERYLVMINESNIKPVVLLSKSDLLSNDEVESRIGEIKSIMPHLHVQAFSNVRESGTKTVMSLLSAGVTYCMLGSSGVGKTTLLNSLIGQAFFKTESVRKKDSKGRHATTSRQLTTLDCGAMIIDTPGMRELGIFSAETGLNETFAEIEELSKYCQYSDCTHTRETGCAIMTAVKDGQLSEKRYENYQKMMKESAYNEMSFLEKKQKDRAFGKFCKTVMKHKKKGHN